MKILDVLKQEAIMPSLNATDKRGVIEEMTNTVAQLSSINKEEMIRVLLERERLGSTGIGGGIAIPHGKMKSLNSLLIGFARSLKGVDFDSIDGKPSHLFFLLMAPEDSTDTHLLMLARISRLLKDSTFKQRLMSASGQQELYDTIASEDNAF